MNLQVTNIIKNFKKNEVLKDLSFSINGGQVYCLLGRNGTGKSTIINLLCNLIEPDKGHIYINDIHFNNKQIDLKKNIGLQSQFNQLIEELNTIDFLEMIGLIYKMGKKDITIRRKELIDYFFDEGEDISKIIKTYSTGMQKKVSLCAAFLHKPDIVLLDEPFTHLDTPTCNKLCSLIKTYSNDDRIIFISSHDLQYVEKIATNIGIIENGKLVFNDSLERFTDTGHNIEQAFLSHINIQAKNEALIAKHLSQ